MRPSRLLLASLSTLLFTFILFIWGYLIQQRSLGALQKAIKPINAFPSGPVPFEWEESEDGTFDAPLCSENQPPPSQPELLSDTWRPRVEGLHSQPGAPPKKKKRQWAHVQFVNAPEEVCSAVMVLARMHDLGSLGARVLLYPISWDKELGLAGERERAAKVYGTRTAYGHVDRKYTGSGKIAPGSGKEALKLKQTTTSEGKKTSKTSSKFPKIKEHPKSEYEAGWDGEATATRWQKSARRILLHAQKIYGIQLIPVEPLDISVFDGEDTHPDYIPIPQERLLDSDPNTYSQQIATKLLIPHLANIITPLHLFNLTQFSRIVYLSPNGFSLKIPDILLNKLQLPQPPTLISPQRYWAPPNTKPPSSISPEFIIIKPDIPTSQLLLSQILFTTALKKWSGNIPSPKSPPSAILAAAGGVGLSSAITTAISASLEVLTTTFPQTSLLLLPSYPWILPTHELYLPTPGRGRRHGSLLGPTREWNMTLVAENIHYIAFTDVEYFPGMRYPWVSQDSSVKSRVGDAIMGVSGHGLKEVKAWEGWYGMYALLRGEVCLLDLMPAADTEKNTGNSKQKPDLDLATAEL
ncbi:hypothetical protein DFH27DRAFT_612340 [Peziza echinospora]|nr:hypothetical protein DFH27DRAFT_612340 [Peziza echinospora]